MAALLQLRFNQTASTRTRMRHCKRSNPPRQQSFSRDQNMLGNCRWSILLCCYCDRLNCMIQGWGSPSCQHL
jgi:hypothetical protein